MPLLCQVFLPLIVSRDIARLRGGYEDVVGCECRSLGYLWHHLDRIVCRMWSWSEFDASGNITATLYNQVDKAFIGGRSPDLQESKPEDTPYNIVSSWAHL